MLRRRTAPLTSLRRPGRRPVPTSSRVDISGSPPMRKYLLPARPDPGRHGGLRPSDAAAPATGRDPARRPRRRPRRPPPTRPARVRRGQEPRAPPRWRPSGRRAERPRRRAELRQPGRPVQAVSDLKTAATEWADQAHEAGGQADQAGGQAVLDRRRRHDPGSSPPAVSPATGRGGEAGRLHRAKLAGSPAAEPSARKEGPPLSRPFATCG